MIGRVARWSLAAVVLSGLVPGGVRAWDPEAEKKEEAEVEKALASLRKSEPKLKVYFDSAYGHAIFPTVGEGGIDVGGGYGKARVYVGGKHVGNTSVTQATSRRPRGSPRRAGDPPRREEEARAPCPAT